jgi:hypothetical protein
LHSKKQLSPITSILLGIRIDLIAHRQKARLPISLNLESVSNVTSQRYAQRNLKRNSELKKQCSPITLTFLGIRIDLMPHPEKADLPISFKTCSLPFISMKSRRTMNWLIPTLILSANTAPALLHMYAIPFTSVLKSLIWKMNKPEIDFVNVFATLKRLSQLERRGKKGQLTRR